MIKTARQLKDLIRNLSREKSADAQILMRNYMMERFLERISLSEYRDKFILKGGMLVAAMVGLDARSTMDLDATIKGANVNVEDIENLISSIVTVPIDDGVKFQLKSISEIMDEAEYPGIRVSMSTTFDGVVTPLKIDISTGDAITPREVRYSFKLSFEDWYAGQFHYKKVDGTPPGEKWRHTTMSVPEMADLLGLKSGTAYDLVKRGYFETTLIDRRIRIITSSFEAWYQKQTHYVKISERSNENGIYREA